MKPASNKPTPPSKYISFLVRKKPPSNGYRLVTSFGSLAAHVKTAPSPMPSVDGILRRMASWKWIITADISQAYHQIPLSKESRKYAGVSTPFKGARVYTTAAMGMPGSETALEELMSRVLGDLIQEGVVARRLCPELLLLRYCVFALLLMIGVER